MIRHTILFKVKAAVSIQEIDDAIHAMCNLQKILPGIFAIVAGECHFHDGKSTDFFSEAVSHAISIDFMDQAGLDRFFNDPITYSAKNMIVNIAEGGYAAIVGFDLMMEDKL
jgi:hypothetical protein